MTPLLATLSANFADARQSLTALLGRIDSLAHPDEVVQHLAKLPLILAAIFVAVGITCMLRGFKVYRWVVVLAALLTGLGVGYKLGQEVEAELIVGCCLGVLLAVIAWPLMKYAVAITGGVAGMFLGANAWSALAHYSISHHWAVKIVDMPWLGAFIGLMLFGLLAFILFELSVVLFTSISGSMLAVIGSVALLLQLSPWQSAIAQGLSTKPLALPMIVLVPAIIAFVIQHHGGGLGQVKKPAPGGPPKK
jgi:hypothetical protein